MKTSEFDFYLPPFLVAQEPSDKRGNSKLMTLNRLTGKREHKTVLQLPDILCEEHFLSPTGEKPLIVFNDTKVRKARLIGKSLKTGANVEFVLLEELDAGWKTLAQRSGRRKVGDVFGFYDSFGQEIARAEITEAQGEFRFLLFEKPIDDDFLDKYGHVPLPPYIKRKDTTVDAERYQTIYAKQTGSAAAPTAGLHFTDEILKALQLRGIETAFVTLHVGLGTFLPVRCENIQDHVMHEEKFMITEKNAMIIEGAVAKKQKIIAVGTTTLRTLESAFCNGSFKRGWQNTSIFIYPGYSFNVVDILFTNFHTPLSTLLMLVSAFAGKELILKSYAEAVSKEYRFFSYGDAMMIF
ncbi:MAG: tRNA preQ1(34) S-adenosylmethionine ribosyltransferase-isomerase QueA [Treponema sp.]|jgi:S-adenosylmethionine:tRNA ribosyltransferase-isomerase|nr:tRNA preQ1(34) S-adenosylmethionine ribosyltransferase-isomerase QueA [Treponema sp.]